jgi:hypothetical protein
MFHVRVLIFMLAVFVWFVPILSQAYGPNVITDNGIVTWQLPVIIDVEGDTTKNCPDTSTVDLSTHITDAATTWQSAPETGLTTTVQTIEIGGSPVAIDENNYCDFMYDLGCGFEGGNIFGPSEVGGYNPIVFDEDGAITDLFFGVNQKTSVLGFAGIVLREVNSLNAAKGEGVVNLYCMNQCPGFACVENFSPNDVLAFVTHELGHFFGMNHTQVNVDQTNETYTTTMFAVFDPSSGADISTLERDDEVGIAYLYRKSPNTLSNDFCAVTGTIRDENADEFQCANVIARNIDTAGNKDLSDAISFVSGGDMPGGSPDPGHGQFTIRGLTPGETYQIAVQQIDTTFPLNSPSSGIIPCSGGNGDPSAPTFDAQTVSETVTCQAGGGALVVVNSGQGLTVTEGNTITIGDVTLANTSGNVAVPNPNGGNGSAPLSGGCSLIR